MKMNNNLTKLFGNKLLSDVCISIKDTEKTFPAHKNILAIASPYFEALFTTKIGKVPDTIVLDNIHIYNYVIARMYGIDNDISLIPPKSFQSVFEAQDFFQLHSRISFDQLANYFEKNLVELIKLDLSFVWDFYDNAGWDWTVISDQIEESNIELDIRHKDHLVTDNLSVHYLSKCYVRWGCLNDLVDIDELEENIDSDFIIEHCELSDLQESSIKSSSIHKIESFIPFKAKIIWEFGKIIDINQKDKTILVEACSDFDLSQGLTIFWDGKESKAAAIYRINKRATTVINTKVEKIYQGLTYYIVLDVDELPKVGEEVFILENI